jgi:branched-chain amino acid transport system ATP-binding protein
MTALLEVRDLSVAYGHIPVIHNLSLSVTHGGITTLLGANGAGKTTLLRAICNMKVRNSGIILFDGRRIEAWATEDIVRLGIGHAPDGRGTFVHLTVEENLSLGAHTRRDHAAIAQDFERAYTYFPRLKERARQQAGTLSGGEQQMLAIARALMLRPKLLLLDEPSFGLAPLIVQEIFRILRRINEEENVSLLLVEQNASLALALATHVYLLETGQVVMDGPASIVSDNAAVRRAYLGY